MNEFFWWLFRPLVWLYCHFLTVDDPWEVLSPTRISFRLLGLKGYKNDAEIFIGYSQVSCNTIDELCAWLRNCEKDDAKLHSTSEYHPIHPIEFEELKVGECGDRSVWAWRKLLELDIDAELVLGLYEGSEPRHAWVNVIDGDSKYILETMADENEEMLVLFEDVKGDYWPEFGLKANKEIVTYAGCSSWIKRKFKV